MANHICTWIRHGIEFHGNFRASFESDSVATGQVTPTDGATATLAARDLWNSYAAWQPLRSPQKDGKGNGNHEPIL